MLLREDRLSCPRPCVTLGGDEARRAVQESLIRDVGHCRLVVWRKKNRKRVKEREILSSKNGQTLGFDHHNKISEKMVRV